MTDQDPYTRYVSENLFDRRERIRRKTGGFNGTGRRGRPPSWTHFVSTIRKIAEETNRPRAQELGGVGRAEPAIFVSHFEVVDRRGRAYQFQSANALNAFMQVARKAAENTPVLGPQGRTHLEFAVRDTVPTVRPNGSKSYGIGPNTRIYWRLAPIRLPSMVN